MDLEMLALFWALLVRALLPSSVTSWMSFKGSVILSPLRSGLGVTPPTVCLS